MDRAQRSDIATGYREVGRLFHGIDEVVYEELLYIASAYVANDARKIYESKKRLRNYLVQKKVRGDIK